MPIWLAKTPAFSELKKSFTSVFSCAVPSLVVVGIPQDALVEAPWGTRLQAFRFHMRRHM